MAPLSVLILEDQTFDFELVVEELRRAGFQTRCYRAESEAEYLIQIRSGPDLILADYALPGFDAPRALELLMAEGLDIPFIVLTGVVSEDRVVECMKRGAADYLLKDRLTRLGPAVSRALEEAELRREGRTMAEALRRSNALFQRLVETTKVIPWELDGKTGRFIYVGPQAVALLGYPADDWYHQGFWSAHVHPDDREAADPFARPSLDYEFTCRMLTMDRATIHLHCVVNSKVCESGARRLCGFMMDITELKKLQLSLMRQAEDLARSNTELKEFAYAISHDLQEPVRMVAFYTQLLAKRYKGQLDSDADEFIGYTVEGATRMRELIQQLLAYSRVSTRKPEFGQVDCEEVFMGSLANLRLAVGESGATVTHDPLPTMTADASQLGQVFQNLIGNAIKFRGTQPPSIHVSAQEEEAAWHVQVRDNGIGVEREYFESIFTLFQRLHTREEYEGSGVGLATCRRIMEHHRGRIWIESEPGAGSTFHFTLPRDPGSQY